MEDFFCCCLFCTTACMASFGSRKALSASDAGASQRFKPALRSLPTALW